MGINAVLQYTILSEIVIKLIRQLPLYDDVVSHPITFCTIDAYATQIVRLLGAG